MLYSYDTYECKMYNMLVRRSWTTFKSVYNLSTFDASSHDMVNYKARGA